MVVEALRLGPDPSRVNTLDDLARELGALRSRAARGTHSVQVSVDELATRVDEPKSTIHAYLTGKRLAPADVLDRIVIALGTTTAEQRAWAEAWYRVRANRETAHRLATRSPGPAAVPHHLPLPVDGFVGRDEPSAQLDALLGRGGTLAVICGGPGVGKTALAVHWAQQRTAMYPDGQLYVDLHGFDTRPPLRPEKGLARLLRVLGTSGTEPPRDVEESAARYRSLLSGRRMLILLDNARDSEQVRPLLPGTRSCAVLVTSRDALTGLVARDGAHRVELSALAPADAVRLLRALVGDQADPGSLEMLAEQCGRLPLALRIAAELAGRRPGVPLATLVDEFAERRLDLLDADDDPRTALREVFAWSYRCLPDQAARVFRLLGRHRGQEVTRDSVAALDGTTCADADRALRLLARAHLIRPTRAGGYAVPKLLHSFAEELAATEEAELRIQPRPVRRRLAAAVSATQPVIDLASEQG